jgi:hypothetical protein
MPNGLELFAQGEMLKTGNRERQHQVDPSLEHAEGIEEGRCLLRIAAIDCRRIGNAPMRRRRTTRPDRAGFRSRAVADGKDQIELRSIGKLAPALGGIAFGWIAKRLKRMDSSGVYLAGRIASGTVGLEPAFAVMVEDGFALDRASGIARTQEQHVQWFA